MSKGGSTSSQVSVPQYVEDAARANLAKADLLAQIGPVTNYGPDVAAFSPMQEDAFRNTAASADALGLGGGRSLIDTYSATGRQMGGIGSGSFEAGSLSGMPEAKTFAGGIRGYSSAPLFEQSMRELKFRKPGQYAALNAPFIDPVTGASPDYPYTGSTGAGIMANNNLSDMERLNRGGTQSNSFAPDDNAFDPFADFDPTQVSSPNKNSLNPFTGKTLFPKISGTGFDDTGEYGYLGDAAAKISDAAGWTNYSGGQADLPGNVVSRALGVGAGAQNDDGGYSGKSDDGCVVATHAVNSGAFSPATKREAVVWCMNVLHGKWWGEAVRRGYRHCGNKKIEQGKARAHYGEFRRYIDFASGKKRTLRGAVTFTLRTAQFFAVGLVKKDA